MKHKKHASKAKEPPKPGATASDAVTIEQEAAQMPDRDQLFETGTKQFPPPELSPTGDPSPASAAGDDWSGDIEEEVKGDRSIDQDAVDELSGVGKLHRDPAPLRPQDLPTPAARAGEGSEYSAMSDTELKRRAEVLGIAGRQAMSRAQLIKTILESGQPA